MAATLRPSRRPIGRSTFLTPRQIPATVGVHGSHRDADEAAFRAEAAWLESPRARRAPASFDTAEGFALHRDWEKVLYDGRWSAVSWPEGVRRRGADYIKWLIFEEEYYRAGAPGRVNQNGIFLLGPTNMRSAPRHRRRAFMPTMASSEIVWAQAWSEPNAGSDLQASPPRATRDGDDWILNGQKIWASRAVWADWCSASSAPTRLPSATVPHVHPCPSTSRV